MRGKGEISHWRQVDNARVMYRGGWRRWLMMAIPEAKQPHGQVDCLGERNWEMVQWNNG
jgi:hypothetical protein